MKVTIEFTTDDDLELLESVFKARAAEALLNAPDPVNVMPQPTPVVPPSPPAPHAFVPAPPDMFGAPSSDALAAAANNAQQLAARQVAAFAPPPQTAPAAPRVDFGQPGERDSEGLPWDGRIHSSSKALLADGKWRQRRNTDPAVVAAVTAELRAALAAPSAPVPAAPPAPAAPPVPPAPPSTVPAYSGVTPALDVTITPPAPPVEPAAMTFPQFMHAITAARLAPGIVLEACKAVGMPSIPALAQRTDLIPAVATALGVA